MYKNILTNLNVLSSKMNLAEIPHLAIVDFFVAHL
jgi:hypothetical protein